MRENQNKIDWHSDPLTRDTPITEDYRHTQNVRRFMKSECGEHFKFNRAFMSWIKNGSPKTPAPKTLGDVADEWLQQQNR